MGRINKKTVHPLSKYHPFRYALMRESFLGQAMETFSKDFPNSIEGVFSTDNQRANNTCLIINDGIKAYAETSKSLDCYPSTLREANKYFKLNLLFMGKYESAVSCKDLLLSITRFEFRVFRHYVSFLNCGSNIFEFPSKLLNVFWETDVDDVLLEDIHLPFSTVYLNFGRQDGKKLYGTVESVQDENRGRKYPFGQKYVDFFLDGAYVTQCPKSGAIKVVLTGVRNSSNYHSNHCIDGCEETLEFELPVFKSGVTVEETLKYQVEKIHKTVYENYLSDKANEAFREYSDFLDSTLVISQSFTKASANQFADTLKLVINCLLYLQSYPDEIQDDYPDSAPFNLVAQTKTKTFVAGVATRKLSDLGYRKIKFCGRNSQLIQQINLEEEGEEILNTEDSIPNGSISRTVSPHKRRTHRRKQRYGKSLQSWRYIWIKETTVHPQKYQPNQDFYRIYEVVP